VSPCSLVDTYRRLEGPAVVILRVAEVDEGTSLNKRRLLKRPSTVLRSYSNGLRGGNETMKQCPRTGRVPM
jgi:hypothetical protein